MALFMPTNITPSTLGALGSGTVDAGKDMTVTWQVDGQNAMTAFEIRIFGNTAASPQLYTTGRRTDGCPFYGRSAKGDVVLFAYTIPASALAAAGISNGNSYKLTITQWWTDVDSVTQQSASVFVCRSAPVLTIDEFTKPVAAKEMTWTASYSQAQGDPLTWVRWRLAAAYDTDKPLYDTGNVATALLQFRYDGLFTGRVYAVRCTAETSNGVLADTGWVEFRVQYDISDYTGIVSVCAKREQSGVLVSWPGAYDIPGTATGDYTVEDGVLTINSGSVSWGTVSGESMTFDPPVSVVWKGVLQQKTQTLFAIGNGVNQNGYSVNVSVILNESSMTISTSKHMGTTGQTTSRYVRFPYLMRGFEVGDEVTVAFTSGGTFLYNKEREVDGSVRAAVSLRVAGASEITAAPVKGVYMFEPCRCDYLWVDAGTLGDSVVQALMSEAGYEPVFTTDTLFLANFAEGLQAGNVSTDKAVQRWSVYRADASGENLALAATVPAAEKSVTDCGAASQGVYTYYIFGEDAEGNVTTPMVSERISPVLWDWSILVCTEEAEDVFRVDDIFRFSLNVSSGSVSNNNKPNLLENFTRYPTMQMDPANYQSGTLSGYLGHVGADAEYSDTLARRDELFALPLSGKQLFLKSRKGDVLKIAVNGSITAQVQDNTRQQAMICAVPWVETGSAEGAQLVVRQGVKRIPGEAHAQLAFENTADGVAVVLLPSDADEALVMSASVPAEAHGVADGSAGELLTLLTAAEPTAAGTSNGAAAESLILRYMAIGKDVIVNKRQIEELLKIATSVPPAVALGLVPVGDVGDELTMGTTIPPAVALVLLPIETGDALTLTTPVPSAVAATLVDDKASLALQLVQTSSAGDAVIFADGLLDGMEQITTLAEGEAGDGADGTVDSGFTIGSAIQPETLTMADGQIAGQLAAETQVKPETADATAAMLSPKIELISQVTGKAVGWIDPVQYGALLVVKQVYSATVQHDPVLGNILEVT